MLQLQQQLFPQQQFLQPRPQPLIFFSLPLLILLPQLLQLPPIQLIISFFHFLLRFILISLSRQQLRQPQPQLFLFMRSLLIF